MPLSSTTGPRGLPGPPGTPGNRWVNPGTAIPSNDAGADGDYFLHSTTADVYRKDAGEWSNLVNLRGPQGDPGSDGAPGTADQASISVDLLSPNDSASAAASNLALNTFNAVSDPNYRRMLDLRGKTHVRIQGRIGGTLVSTTRLRVQYHTGANPAVTTGDAGWTTLAESAGSHTLNTMFYSAELQVPAGAQINPCLIRVGLVGGDGAADSTITCCVLNFYVP